MGVLGGLEPVAAFEHRVQDHRDQDHQAERERVAEDPVQLGHVVEVHAVDGADQGRREEDGGPAGDLLDLLVLRVDWPRSAALHLLVLRPGHQGRVDGEDVLQQLPEAVHPFDHAG